jgi:MoaA/NifB/PqqE/SkfB family radical SAM enzyme
MPAASGPLELINKIRNVMSGIDLSKTAFPNALSLSKVLLTGEIKVRKNRSLTKVMIPRFMYFSITHACNLSCKGCYAKSWKKGEGLSLEQIFYIIDQARQLGTYIFVIAGGEPLIVEGLIQEIGKRKNTIFILFTNGTLIDEELADLIIDVGNILPVISLDGPKDYNDSRRGPKVWEKATNAMTLLRQRGGLFAFSTMLTHTNYKLMLSREYLDQMWGLGCRLGFFIDYIPFPKDLKPDYVLTTEDFQIKADLVMKFREENHPYIVNFPPDEYLMNNGRCMAGKTSVHVNADGWLEPCPYSHYASHNLLDTPLIEALQSKFFKALSNEVLDEKNLSNTCHLFAMEKRVKEVADLTGAESRDENPILQTQ